MAAMAHREDDEDDGDVAYLCEHVFRGKKPVLHVDRGGGDWQFLCGGGHRPKSLPKLVHLEEAFALDESLEDLRDLHPGWKAERRGTSSPWERTDLREAAIRDDIATRGFHVLMVAGDDEGPGFGYTIGLHERFDHPEVLMIGLPMEKMSALLSGIGTRVSRGMRFAAEQANKGDVFTDAEVVFKKMSVRNIVEHCGYALWYYEGEPFQVLQCVWPDNKHRFPWDKKVSAEAKRLQPVLT
jgi:hypothetical protein